MPYRGLCYLLVVLHWYQKAHYNLTATVCGMSGICWSASPAPAHQPPRWRAGGGVAGVLPVGKEKYLQHQQDLYHVFIHFKKAFDRVWHADLRAIMKKYDIIANLIRVIKTSVTRPLMPSSSTAAWGTGSGQQLESDSDVYSHPPSSTCFWKESWQTP